ncbi:response regulator transcription factor [Pedobacter panaciterrae]|jgi:DNA-binding LytR/AlgR family response regulator|uniref:LytR/AlgR family response regulator transcription factor n=1 Tax=Pedobacter panaciterrae TaxID=363849 RepID=UPI00155DCDCE|nr:LytTR family DNA-binding domain-containing protein [Pedobacter panaciterrae]NQX55902.1 response regulator transcription factor [Pedobacter panaciterrae]
MNCIIVDDEPLARAEMEALINEVSSAKILGSFSNAWTALDFLKSNKVDLIFLDIEMPMVTGLDFATQLSGSTLVIFTTAYPQYALKSYELDAIDYLLKPIDKGRLDKAIKKAETYQSLLSGNPEKNTLEGNTADFLLIKSDRRFHRIKFENMRFIEGLKDYVVIHLAGQKLITAMNLKTFHQKIPQDIFLRVSKSYVVNKNYIESFDHHTIYLGTNELPIGEVYKKDFFTIYSGGSISPEI